MAVDTRYITHDKWASSTSTELTYPSGRKITSGYDPLYRKNSIDETSGGASIAAWQFFGQRTATVSLGNGIVSSNMNDAQTRSAVQLGQTTPGWGDITTDHLGYDGAGRLYGKRHFNGSTVTVGFTSAYDKSSNKFFERHLHAESRASLYDSYDSMNRLLDYERGTLASGGGSITTPIALPGTNQQQAYNLDALGNWSTTTITPEGGSTGIQSRTHNKLNEVTQYGVSPASTAVLYDHGNNSGSGASRGNGNIADDGMRTYAYDAFNRLTTIKRKSDGATIGQYTYDAMGRRIRKIVSNGGLPNDSALNGTTDYLYDGQQIIEDRSVSGSTQTTVAQYIWGQYIDELIEKKTYANTGSQPLAAGTYYLLSDLLYRSVALTSTPTGGASAAIVEAYDTDAYGNTICYAGPGADGIWFTNDDLTTTAPANNTIFTGRQYDPETQIYWYRARYYHPMLGRFVSRDSFGYQAGVSLYEFVTSNPNNRTDPSGQLTEVRCGAAEIAEAAAQCAALGGWKSATCYDLGVTVLPNGTTIQTTGVVAICKNTGDCSAVDYLAIRTRVQLFCKTLPRSCKGIICPCQNTMDKIAACARIAALIADGTACVNSRQEMMDKCFKGGDAAHKAEVVNSQVPVNACKAKWTACGC